MPLSEHVYCVAITFKITEWVEQCASNLALSLNIPLQKTLRWFWRTELWATGDWQLDHDNTPTHAKCFGKTSNHPGDSATLQPRFGTLQLLAFPKTKSTFKREEISDCQWDSGKYKGAADGHWANCVRSQGVYFEGDWGIIVLCTMFFLYLILLQ